jgi:hypothetical protein
MAVAALANISQWMNVTWSTTTDAQGRPTTLLTLDGVRGEERNGKTVLVPKELNQP